MLNLTPLSASEASALAAGLTKAQRHQMCGMSENPMRWSTGFLWVSMRNSLEDRGLIRSLNGHAIDRTTEITPLGLAVRAILQEQAR